VVTPHLVWSSLILLLKQQTCVVSACGTSEQDTGRTHRALTVNLSSNCQLSNCLVLLLVCVSACVRACVRARAAGVETGSGKTCAVLPCRSSSGFRFLKCCCCCLYVCCRRGDGPRRDFEERTGGVQMNTV
jgi:hypothetical protein